MDILFTLSIIIFTIFGLCIGSFINAYEYRLKHKLDFVKKRSMCPHCKHELGPLDLIPVFSFIFLRGKCRYCNGSISIQYPLVELLSGGLFGITAFYYSTQTELISLDAFNTYLIIVLSVSMVISTLLFISLYDFKYKIIPNEVIIPAITLGALVNVLIYIFERYSSFQLVEYLPDLGINALIAGVAGFTFFFLIAVATSGKGMGGGDIKLGAFLGLVLGVKGLVAALYIGFIAGAVFGIIKALITHKMKGQKLALGPFLCLGCVIAIFYYSALFNLIFPNIELLFTEFDLLFQ